jgi:hypothetical protein
MAGWLAAGRVSRRQVVVKGSVQAWGVVSSWILRGVDFQGGEQVAGCLGDVGALAEGADGAGLAISLLRPDGQTNIAAANRHYAPDPQRTLRLLQAA